METKPDNCVVWGERNDVDTFIQACDVHLFSSILELNPLSIKESLEYEKPTMIFNLPNGETISISDASLVNAEKDIFGLNNDKIMQ